MAAQKVDRCEDERERQVEFLHRHQGFYDRLVSIMADCIERDDVHEFSLHVAYLGQVINQALNLRLSLQQQHQEQGRSGTA